MSRLAEGSELDGFRIGPLVHAGAMALIHAVEFADGRPAPFPMVMKVPRMTAGDGGETIVSFEVEHQLLQILHGPHVPRFVAAGDLARVPYLVMEYLQGQTLEQRIAAVTSARLANAYVVLANGQAFGAELNQADDVGFDARNDASRIARRGAA